MEDLHVHPVILIYVPILVILIRIRIWVTVVLLIIRGIVLSLAVLAETISRDLIVRIIGTEMLADMAVDL